MGNWHFGLLCRATGGVRTHDLLVGNQAPYHSATIALDLERTAGLEPATFALARRHSTTELRPREIR